MDEKWHRHTVTTKSRRYQVTLVIPADRPATLLTHWYDWPKKKGDVAAYGVTIGTYQVKDLGKELNKYNETKNWFVELDLGVHKKTDLVHICGVRMYGVFTTTTLPLAELLDACLQAGAVSAISYPSGSRWKLRDIVHNYELHPDDVTSLSGYGYNNRLGINHPETKALALHLADEHKSKNGKTGTGRTQREYLAEGMTQYSADSCMAALKAARRDEKNKPKKRKTQ